MFAIKCHFSIYIWDHLFHSKQANQINQLNTDHTTTAAVATFIGEIADDLAITEFL